MTSPRRFEQDLPALLADLYVAGTPDYRDDIVQRIGRVRQRPAWTFPERWIPMDVLMRAAPTRSLPWRQLGVLALLALLIAAVLAFYVGSQRRVPPPFGPARNGQIVYGQDGDIFARSSFESSPRLIVSGDPRDVSPQFSRQGDQFIFLRRVTTTTGEVLVSSPDGSRVRQLAGPLDSQDAWDWSPSGRLIVIGWDGDSKMSIIPTDGSTPTSFDVGLPAQRPTWRPPADGQLMFRAVDKSGRSGLYLVKPDGTDVQRLDLAGSDLAPDHDFNHGVSWSPDGRFLAYEILEPNPRSPNTMGLRIHVAELDPAGKVIADRGLEFDEEADDELNPGWLPTGDRLIFQTREGTSDYLGIAAADGSRSVVSVGPKSNNGGGIGYEIAPDGRSLLVLFWLEKTSWRYDLDTQVATPGDIGPDDVATYQRLAP